MRLEWHRDPPMYDRGVDQGVLYLDGTAVPWNGLVGMDEKEVGTTDTEHYLDGVRVHISHETGDFEATVSAYTYPEVFEEYNGFSEREENRRFGFSYRTQHGENGYKIHLVYNVLVRDTQREWFSTKEQLDPSLFAWDILSAAEKVPGASPAGHLIIESPKDPSVLSGLEDILYGTDTTEPRLPDPAEIVELYEAATVMRVTYLGDGRYQVSGPDDMVQLNGDGSFTISAPTVHTTRDGDSFVVGSY